MKLNSAQVQRTLGQFEARVIPDEDPVIAQLNEPVAPELCNILPDELFQTSRNCSDLRDMSFHTFDMPRLLNQRELLGSVGTRDQPST